jgi:hypothetical protein
MCHAKASDAIQSSVHQSIFVNASPKSCWEALRNPTSCPDHRRVLSEGDGEAVVEETFDNLPVLHSSTCVFKELETPFKKIEFSLVRSTGFKSMQGSWVITPVADGKSVVEINSFLDTGIHLPFARKIASDINEQKCKERLALIKTLAENSEHPKISLRSL